MKLLLTVIAFILLIAFPKQASSQDSSSNNLEHSVSTVSNKAIHVIENKYSLLDKIIQKQTERMLHRMQKKEEKLQRKLQSIDSSKAKVLFANTQVKYQQLLLRLNSPIDKGIKNPLKEYIPGMDSVQTALQFLQRNNINLPMDKLQSLQALDQQIKQVQGSLQKANDIQQVIKERELELKSQLENSGVGHELLSVNKEAFYYQQQLAEYKSLLNDKKKLEEKLLTKLRDLPVFQDFMKKNSYLGQLFGLPEDYGSLASIIGLQTKSQIQQLLGQRFGTATTGASGGMGSMGFVQQQIQAGQQQIQQMQNQVQYLGAAKGSSDDIVMPDFKPNQQKTKSFVKRLQYGTSFNSNKATLLAPAITDIGLTISYKINEKSLAGIGASYKLGTGYGLNHISLSSQGAGIRSFLDLKLKGSIWVSGGFEYNYLNAFAQFERLYNLNAWQKSALIGVTKKYKISGKKSGSIQLLYDMLYKDHLPLSQPVVFRMGYTL